MEAPIGHAEPRAAEELLRWRQERREIAGQSRNVHQPLPAGGRSGGPSPAPPRAARRALPTRDPGSVARTMTARRPEPEQPSSTSAFLAQRRNAWNGRIDEFWIESSHESPRAGQGLGIVDDEVVAVVGGDDQDRVVPVAVGLDPADDGRGWRPRRCRRRRWRCRGCWRAARSRRRRPRRRGRTAGRVGGQDGQGGLGHVGQGRLLDPVGRRVGLGGRARPCCRGWERGRSGRRPCGRGDGRARAAEEAEEAGRPPRRGLRRPRSSAWPPLAPGSVWTTTYLPPFLTSIAARSASVMKRLPDTPFLPCAQATSHWP